MNLNFSKLFQTSKCFVQCRFVTNVIPLHRVGVALDVDGVLIRGNSVLDQALPALQLIADSGAELVFITNGGGRTERDKSKELSKKLNFTVNDTQIVQSHTPLIQLVSKYEHKNILIIGHQGCVDIAKFYGFKYPISSVDIHNSDPSCYPVRKQFSDEYNDHRILDIAAVMIFHDSIDWGLDIQVLTDIMIKSRYNIDSELPIYVTNNDIIYQSHHPAPRYTQGAFMLCFKELFRSFSHKSLNIINYGKPFPVQYRFAEQLLLQNTINKPRKENKNEKRSASDFMPLIYYGIGDNPKSDIRGANNAGDHWKSILVRTGVFRGKDNDAEDPADIVLNDVLEAARYILGSHS